MREFRIGEYTYRVVRPMSAFTQMDVITKIGPLLASGFGELVPLFLELKASGGFTDLVNMDIAKIAKVASMATPVARELAHMSRQDRKDLVGTCLATVDRKRVSETHWAPIWESDSNISMFEDINQDAFLMLRITLGVLQETFRNFLPESLFTLIGGVRG